MKPITKTLALHGRSNTWDSRGMAWLCNGTVLQEFIEIPKTAKKLHLIASLDRPHKISNVIVLRASYSQVKIGRSTVPTYTYLNYWLRSLYTTYDQYSKIYLSFEWS